VIKRWREAYMEIAAEGRERLYKGLKAKAGIALRGNIRQLQSEDKGARREGTGNKRRYGWEASVTAGKEIEDDTA
jgi:hypothetical protein